MNRTSSRTKASFLWMIALLLSSLACQTATRLLLAGTPVPSTSQALPDLSGIAAPENPAQDACPSVVNGIMEAVSNPAFYDGAAEQEDLVTYQVVGDTITNPSLDAISASLKTQQDDRTTQQNIWNYFTALLPAEVHRNLAEYRVFTDGKGNLLAAVSQLAADPTHWLLEVDVADATDVNNLTFTLIHESGHLLTLNAVQVPPNMDVFEHPADKTAYTHAVSMCPTYFTGEGCSQPDSYINQFYQRFWTRIYGEWIEIDRTADDLGYYEKMNQFYVKYEDQFVSDYAATNPGEDIAESWAYFVLAPRPAGNTVAEQKVLFFYEYPELVSLRAQILRRLCTAFPK